MIIHVDLRWRSPALRRPHGYLITRLLSLSRREWRSAGPDRRGDRGGRGVVVPAGLLWRSGAKAAAGAPDAETCISHSKVQFQPSFSSAKCTSREQSAHLDDEGPVAVLADRDDHDQERT